jgi:hypothetical protein
MTDAVPVAALEPLEPGLAGGPALGSVVMVGKQSPGLTGLPSPQVEGGETDALHGSNPGDRFTCGPAEAGKNGLPAFRWNGFHGIELISRSRSTPHLESQLRSLDNYPDTGGVGMQILTLGSVELNRAINQSLLFAVGEQARPFGVRAKILHV